MPASASIHSWHMPGPNGPSRITVGGTTSQPAAAGHHVGGHLAAGQRAGREVPQRPLPRHRLVHAGGLGAVAADRAVQGRVGGVDQPALHLERAPVEQLERASRTSAALAGTGGSDCRCLLPGVCGAAALFTGSGSAWPARWPFCRGHTWPVGVQRQPAQRARRPARRDELQRALRERPGRARADPHPQHAGPVAGDVIGQRLDRRVALLLRLDDHPVAVAVPGERDRADPEVLGQRQVERAVVAQRRRGGCRDRGGRRCGAAPRRAARRSARRAGSPGTSPGRRWSPGRPRSPAGRTCDPPAARQSRR